jgi:hypothetical protein
MPWPRPVGRIVSAMPLLLPLLERDNGLLAALQVPQLHHAVGVSGLQELRALQSDVFPVAIRTRNAVYGLSVVRDFETGGILI